jgi:hypothetical protein
MEHSIVAEYDEVINNVKAFNEGLEQGKDLENQLAYFRAWYYIPELDMVGPSKYIGYKGMTADEYMNSNALDGKETVAILGRWFRDLDEKSPEFTYVDQLTERLLAKYGKRVNRVAWYNAPMKWKMDKAVSQTIDLQDATTESDKKIAPIVEVFWRAYLGLYPEDQRILAKRIIEYIK